MTQLELRTKFKNNRQINLFRAKDGRHYIKATSYVAGEDIYFEWLTKEDYQDVWKSALETLWEKA
jgi:hypothetical protein